MADQAATASRATAKWLLIRRVALALYFAVIVGYLVIEGVPTGRFLLMSSIGVGLALTAIGRGWNALIGLVLDWLPFSVVLMVYDFSRGLTHLVGMPVQDADVAHAERWLFGGTVPTIWLQQHFASPTSVRWYDALATLIYISHFLVTPVIAALLWLRDRAAWFSFVVRVVVLSVAGLATYVFFPEAPPWLAAQHHYIGPVARLSARGWIWLHANHVQSLLTEAQESGSNPVAAMPSLHTAFATLVVLFIGSRLRSRWRWLLALYPAAMGLVLVYTGEHYVIDVAAGVVYAVGVHLLVSRWEARRAATALLLAAGSREAVRIG